MNRESERQRLVELIKKAHDEQQYLTSDKSINAIADYLLDNGVVVPLLAVRTKVYTIILGKIYEYEIASYTLDFDGVSFVHLAYMEGNTMYGCTKSIEEFNKQFYTTREEAEAKLGGKEDA